MANVNSAGILPVVDKGRKSDRLADSLFGKLKWLSMEVTNTDSMKTVGFGTGGTSQQAPISSAKKIHAPDFITGGKASTAKVQGAEANQVVSGQQRSKMSKAINAEDLTNIGTLYQNGYDLRAKYEMGRTALHQAAASGKCESFLMVLNLIHKEHGSENKLTPVMCMPDDTGKTPKDLLIDAVGVLRADEVADAYLSMVKVNNAINS
nr:hypothetical protein [Endozoicomonas sp.]